MRSTAASLLVVLASIAVFAPSLRHGFIYDDHFVVAQNPRAQHLAAPWEFFLEGYWRPTVSGDSRPMPPLYRPLTLLSFAVGHSLHGLRPWGYHASNLALHALATLLVLRLALRLGWSPAAARRAALLFGVLAIHTEAVVPVFGRSELLAACGVLAMVLVHLGPPGRWRSAVASLAFLAALLAKESAVGGVLLCAGLGLLLPERTATGPWGRLRGSRLLLHGLALVAFLALRTFAVGLSLPAPAEEVNPLAHVPVASRVLQACHLLVQYAVQTVVPRWLSAEYSPCGMGAIGVGTPGGWIILAAVPTALLLLRGLHRGRGGLAIGAGWFLLAFAATSNVLFPIGTLAGDRLAYLPSVGIALLLAGPRAARRQNGSPDSTSLTPGRPRLRQAALVAFALIVLAQAAVATWYTTRWRSGVALFETAVDHVPHSERAHKLLARSLLERSRQAVLRGDFSAALADLQRSVSINPDDLLAQQRLGLLLVQTGQIEEGRRQLLRVLAEAPPDSPVARECRSVLQRLR